MSAASERRQAVRDVLRAYQTALDLDNFDGLRDALTRLAEAFGLDPITGDRR
jgi:hypothetical protein